ncbi:MAG: hypothetical protein GX244_00575 [Firmicutes bacterium]|nr:hypothetical protein [Bacillota bacterium]
MPNVAEERERKKATDLEEQSGESTSEQENKGALEEESEPVQTGNLSDADRSKLIEDPAAETGSSGSGKVAEIRRQIEERAKKKDAGYEPTAEAKLRKIEVEGIAKLGVAKSGIQKFGGRSGSKASGSEATENAPAQPASTPSPDKYELLKKDVNSLSDTEKEERAELLIEKYVVDWKKKKEEQMKELTEGLDDKEKSKEETRKSDPTPKGSNTMETIDDIVEGVSTLSDVTDYGMSVASDFSKESDGMDKASNITGIATGSIGMATSGYGALRASWQAGKKAKKGDSRGAKLAGFDILSSIFGFTSGATGTASGITGLAGKDKASDRLGLASGAAGFAGSSIEMLKGIYEFGSYRRLANRKESEDSKVKMANKYVNARERYKQMKEEYAKGGEGARSKEKRMEMLRQRHDRKRSKDFTEAIASAQEHAKVKSRGGIGTILKGAGSTLGGGIGLAGSFLKHFAGKNEKLKLAGSILGAVGGGISLATTGLSWLGKTGIFNKFSGPSAESVNEKKGKEYIESKADKLMKKPEAQADHMTKEEARIIVAKRLGVNDPSNYAEVYKKLAERRADRILNKEEGYQEVLAALGLSEKADKATILEALGVS